MEMEYFRPVGKNSAVNIALLAIMTALATIMTLIIQIPYPGTTGYFNFGDTMVMLGGLLLGPVGGFFAGGVGSMLADLFLGYPYYAPATLIIKACEGFVVGTLKNKKPKFSSEIYWKIFTLFLGIIAGSLLAGVGFFYYSGLIELTLGFTSYTFLLPAEFWLFLGLIVAFFTSLAGFVTEPEFGWSVFSVITGGLVMVFGYFFYQTFLIGWLFNIQAVAIAELPINIGQMIIGATLALPAARIVWRSFPELGKDTK